MEILRRVHLIMAHPWWSNNPKTHNKECSKNSKTKIRSGFVPVYVGENPRRFVVPIWCFSSKTFQALLEEYEDHIRSSMRRGGGPMHLPCSVELFQTVLDSVMDQNVNDNNVGLHGHAHSYDACFKVAH